MSTTTMRRQARDTHPLGHLEGVTVLHCDADCEATFHAGLVQNRGGTRLVATAHGWRHVHVAQSNTFRDYCPAHRPAERSQDKCPEWNCPDLSAEDRREGKTCPDHPCTCAPESADPSS